MRSFDQGFKFLGSVFCRSLVFDAPRRRDRDGPEVVRSFAELAGDDKALASLGEEGSWMRLLASGPDPGEEERRWRSPVASQGPDKRVAYIVSGDARVSGRKHGLWIERKGLPPQCIAWANLAQVVVLGGHFIAPSLYNHAMQHRVPVALHRRDGSPLGLVLPDGVRSPSPRAIRQWAWGRDARNGLPVARALVEAKISNTRLLLRRQGESRDDILEMLAGLAKLATCAESIDRLRGVEGQAAHAWFSAWPELVGADFPWPGRTGRGARDPVNAMLNLLYTMLYRRTWLATLSAGLDAYAGILHAANGRHAALASDLMEPFRFLADRAVLEALHRRRVRPEDFVYDEKSRVPVRLREPTLKLLVELWEAALAREVEWQGTKASYQRHLDRQARSLAEVVDGERAGIEAFRMKW
ncbi:MAG: CRISPR-associated endonuclease Cas1 [Deltaproteobacteria bacterium]|nr:CRISPR-associated endonuclease Cas1 [Deltaproteobacteria bacterium]